MRGEEWWRPERFAMRRPALETRARIVASLRAFFAEQDFLEVETPCLQVSPGTEPHIMALETRLRDPFASAAQRFFLHSSPELAMKKLLVAGLTRIFQIAHVWRDGERSPLHHPEFTMLEWYRIGANCARLVEDCAGLLVQTARAAGVDRFRRGARWCDPMAQPIMLSVADAFTDYAGVDLLASCQDPLHPDREKLAGQTKDAGLYVGENDSWEDIFFRIMLERIEPHLGDKAPLVLYRYPLTLAALAKPCADDPRLAERFELYICGLELANAFDELTDAVEQRRRFLADLALKEQIYGIHMPLDEDFLDAIAAGLPNCAGIALGIDRLVMLATGAEDIEAVLWAPVRASISSN
ncbi:MAG TPA: EF-P lysine aminoacylase GenX [Rhodospirillaceae bacterium]|nr:EF-P lysine aminoacylase GenX [Rhodospirillaceae bacterium]